MFLDWKTEVVYSLILELLQLLLFPIDNYFEVFVLTTKSYLLHIIVWIKVEL